MAISRRLLTTLTRPSCIRPKTQQPRGITTQRFFSAEDVSHPSNRVQICISRSSDPYLNLSIEHFLLQKTPPDSVVLFLYTNRPCVVIGRNQNPWVEVNLGLLKHQSGIKNGTNDEIKEVQLVRRRSGGGTVFHDAGNVNYSVICPPASFDRNKHAEMVVWALSSLNISGSARVNERHDIVLDLPSSSSSTTTSASESASSQSQADAKTKTYKISGSAYKLTRLRSLHHGTCLLNSPNLPLVSALLRSPAAPFIKARGVESVRSPIRNVGVIDTSSFEEAVVSEFGAMYGNVDPEIIGTNEAKALLDDVPVIAKGYAELRSLEWVYTQTPQFSFSTHPMPDDPRPRPPLPDNLPRDFRVAMTVRHGQIVDVEGTAGLESLNSVYLHQVADWREKVGHESIGKWFNNLFGVGNTN
ncbi:hypothetical protein M426DRAFT_319855 [Hypoxylon sp. CI-4A]|nr:hypothetical protein M426DRAFT_319855 [Hypoxylon sp. CI-4A]